MWCIVEVNHEIYGPFKNHKTADAWVRREFFDHVRRKIKPLRPPDTLETPNAQDQTH
jgi:hypothetical protein